MTDIRSRRRVFSEGFAAEFRPAEPGAEWLSHGDGVTTSTPEGLRIVSSGTNPDTGEPAFADTGAAGDHLKWTMLTRGAGDGPPGFDIPDGGELGCAVTLSGRTFGTSAHPFGDAVTEPDGDPRLAAAAVIAVDAGTGTVFDFLVTTTRIHAYYERAGKFAYSVPVATRTPCQTHVLEISCSQADETIRWRLDGTEVLALDRIGHRALPARHLTYDHGGAEEPVAPRRLAFGLGMLTQLGGAGPDGIGLVRPATSPAGSVVPHRFVRDRDTPGDRQWGQGVRIDVRQLDVHATAR